ncbi:DUF7146 domain-containing protein [Litorimonas sp. WD9-15]|uniref:DUF7146 domain-containing protein n=1 Tax=Litorimonas sp. WD9-15 TaxID=3418716 RepID=UPI003D03CC71
MEKHEFERWVQDVKDANPITDVAVRLGLTPIGTLRQTGWTRFECPACGSRDRFDVNNDTAGFNCCRGSCDLRGGDAVALVQAVMNCDFPAAMTWLGGDKPITDETRVRNDRAREERAVKAREADRAKHRRNLKRIDDVMAGCRPLLTGGARLTSAEKYLRARGLGPALDGRNGFALSKALMFHPDLPAFAGDPGERVEVGRFPAMIGLGHDAKLQTVCLHRTYLMKQGGTVVKARPDFKDFAPDFAAALSEKWDAKQVLGSAKRAVHGIRLGATSGITDDPRLPICVSEGIESGVSAPAAGVEGTFFAAMNLGRLTGDRDGQGWVPPHAANKSRPIIILAENDLKPTLAFSDPAARAQHEFKRAARRLQKLGWRCAPAIPTARADFNDLLMGVAA